MMNKRCPKCEEIKPASEFYRYFSKSRQKYRTSNYCITCGRVESNKRAKEHYKKNKEQKKEYAKKYRVENSDKVKALSSHFTKKYREELQDCYVAEFAAKALKCSTQEIHSNPELLEVYRKNMKLKRKIRNHGKK